MTGLMMKDALVMRKTLRLYALFLLFYSGLAVLGVFPMSMALAMVEVIVMVLPISSFSYDEAAKWDRYAAVLPVGRTAVVKARYLFLLLVLLGSWWGVRRRDRAAEQEAEAEHLLAGAGEPNALPRRWVTLFWSQRSSIAESRWAGMVESSLIIGSDAAQCDLCLPDRKVSPQHCVLAAQGDALLVQPLSDRAKVYVNGERIDGEHRLQNNDTLRIGKTTVRLVL